MFETQESTPWHQSLVGLIGASIILPPIGLVLLWLRRNTTARAKILGTLLIALLGTGYFVLFNAWRHYGNRSEEHTSELQSQSNIVCRLLLEKKITNKNSGSPETIPPSDVKPSSFWRRPYWKIHTSTPEAAPTLSRLSGIALIASTIARTVRR